MATDTPVQIAGRAQEVPGQAQPGIREPSDGRHFVEEVAVVTDQVISDVNHPLAVQVPEGIGASHSGHRSPLGQAFRRGHVEDQFADAEGRTDEEPAAEESVSTDEDKDTKDSAKS